MTVKVFNWWANLIEIALHFNFVKALSAAQKFIQSLILAELQQYIDIFSVLEEMLEPHDVVLVQATMDLDLGHELLLGAWLGEWGLRDHLGSWNSLSFQVRELVALSETTLSKEFASKIFFDADVSIELYNLFFDNNLSIILLVLWRLSRLLLGLHVWVLLQTICLYRSIFFNYKKTNNI
jgi:hypothetical protein